MGVTTFTFAPGLNKEDSPLASEGGYIDGNNIRFVAGRPQTIGGWDFMALDRFAGIARGQKAWADLTGLRHVAFGTAEKLYTVVGNGIRDITPPHSEGVLTNVVSTINGSPVVTIGPIDHAFVAGMVVTFSNQSAPVGGISLSGDYPVTIIDKFTYTIVTTSDAAATATGGGNIDYVAALPPGLIDGTGDPGGYGTGAYGLGGYGATDALDTLPRVWFLDNWGETLVALPRGGGLYQWQPAAFYPELISNGTFGSAIRWTLGAGWTVSGGKLVGTPGAGSDASIAVPVKAGMVYRVMVTTTAAAGALTIKTNAGLIGDVSEAISVGGTYSRLCLIPADATRLVISKNAAFNGSIDNLSVKLEDVAYRVDEAPKRNAAMFVDPHQIVVMLGTIIDDVYYSMGVRWCDRQNLRDWTPTVANLAGDDILSQGSRLITGIPTRQQNAIFSDSSLFTMQFTNNADNPFIFNPSGSGCGIIGALACTEHDGIVYWWSRDNFYRFAGAAPEPITSKIRRDVFEHVAVNQGEKVSCGFLPAFSEFWGLYPDGRDGTECSRYAAIRMDEGHSTSGTFARSGWITPGIYENPIVLGTDGYVYFHERGDTAAGGAIDWFLDSAYFDIGDGEFLARVMRIIPDFLDQRGPVNITFYSKPWPTGAETVHGPFLYTGTTDRIDTRIVGRQLKMRFSGHSAPAYVRFGSEKLDIAQTGMRR